MDRWGRVLQGATVVARSATGAVYYEGEQPISGSTPAMACWAPTGYRSRLFTLFGGLHGDADNRIEAAGIAGPLAVTLEYHQYPYDFKRDFSRYRVFDIRSGRQLLCRRTTPERTPSLLRVGPSQAIGWVSRDRRTVTVYDARGARVVGRGRIRSLRLTAHAAHFERDGKPVVRRIAGRPPAPRRCAGQATTPL